MLVRDGVTEVVVPEVVRGLYLAAGRPSAPAVAFFAQVLGEAPTVEHHAWVFTIATPLATPHFRSAAMVDACVAAIATRGPSFIGPCLLGGTL